MLVDRQFPRENVERLLYFCSPLLLLAVCIPAQYVSGPLLGRWAWVPTMLLFWATITAIIIWLKGRSAFRDWLQPSQASVLWPVLAVIAGLFSLPGFILHWQLILEPAVFIAWLSFGLINPWFEEAYWRGLLIDSTKAWGGILSVIYSSVWFALSHPLIWGIHTRIMCEWPVIIGLLFVGLIWGTVYYRSRSIRWTIIGHMLANLLGMAAVILLNLYDPLAR